MIEARNGIEEHWGETPVAGLCLQIIDNLATLNPQEWRSLSYRALLNMAQQSDISAEFLAALNVLTTSEFAILKAGGYFLSENGEECVLTDEDLRSVILNNEVIDPHTGEFVSNAADRVTPYFSVLLEV